jgi:ribose transport system ATP-binding protein
MTNARLVISNLNKSYATPVLKDVSLTVGAGEIHAIVGENGAGKSTLVNILAGLVTKNSGELYLNGQAYLPQRATDAFATGISVAAQELTTIDTLTIAENIRLRSLPSRFAIVDQRELEQSVGQLLKLVGLENVSADALVETLSLADRQLVEIAKTLARDSALLILDEPTAALTAPQASRLHEIIRERAAAGTSIIYISHRLGDVLDIADSVSVLRDGQVVISQATEQLTVDDLVEAMAGQVFQQRDSGDSESANRPIISAEEITTADLARPISVVGYRGEIIGIAGLAGAGRSELLQALFGLTPLTSGRLKLIGDDREIDIQSAGQAVRAGLAFLGEDRQAMGLFAGQSVLTNMMLPGRAANATPFRRIDAAAETIAATRLGEKLDIRCNNINQDILELSGGNQQKALIGRWLNCDSDVFLLDEPTRGVDVGTKGAIYDQLFELRDNDKCVFIASSEIEELMTVCNRILVLSGRKLVREFKRGEWSEKEILSAAFEEFTPGQAAAGAGR